MAVDFVAVVVAVLALGVVEIENADASEIRAIVSVGVEPEQTRHTSWTRTPKSAVIVRSVTGTFTVDGLRNCDAALMIGFISRAGLLCNSSN